MNKEYINALDIIENTLYKLNKIYQLDLDTTMEDKNVYRTIENLIGELESAKWTIEYFAKPVKEGHLVENNQNKFYIEFVDGTTSYPLSCGYAIEAYLDGEWHVGRIEHNTKGYYFHGADKPMLYRGMRVRIRG